MPVRHALLSLCALVVTTAACGSPSDLLASMQAPAVELSSSEHWQEVAFRARARTSETPRMAEVRAHVSCDVPTTDNVDPGQVRVMLAKEALEDDHARGENVLPVEPDASASVARAAFESCTGECDGVFLVVLSAEGIPDGVRVEVPLALEATLSYDGDAPEGDSVELELLDQDTAQP